MLTLHKAHARGCARRWHGVPFIMEAGKALASVTLDIDIRPSS